MNLTKFEIAGPALIEPKVYGDTRGFFTERYKLQYSIDLGLPEFIQDNFSRSKARVLRGLHYQWDQPQGKLVTALRGKIFDVAVDVRKNSPSFGKHISVTLDGDKPQWLWIPPGFAHGFCVLGDEPADVMYKVDTYYNPKGEYGIVYNDPTLKINWPINEPLLSPKDQEMQSFLQYSDDPKFL
jgi:dTDP-4-dehydrorhamnose 3,5-epimerase